MWTFSNCLFNSSITGWLRRYSLCLTLPDGGSLTVIASFRGIWNTAIRLFMNYSSGVCTIAIVYRGGRILFLTLSLSFETRLFWSASRYMVSVRTICKSFFSATSNSWSRSLSTWSFVSNVGRFRGIFILTPFLTDRVFSICLLFGLITYFLPFDCHLLGVRSLCFDILLTRLGGSFNDVIIGFLLIFAHLILLDASLHHLTVHEFIHFTSELPKIFKLSRRDASIAVICHFLSESQCDR